MHNRIIVLLAIVFAFCVAFPAFAEETPTGCPQGNYSCWLLSDPETGEQSGSICLENCSAPH